MGQSRRQGAEQSDNAAVQRPVTHDTANGLATGPVVPPPVEAIVIVPLPLVIVMLAPAVSVAGDKLPDRLLPIRSWPSV